jgi:hypothetical protein
MQIYFSIKTPKSPKGDFKVPFRGFRGSANHAWILKIIILLCFFPIPFIFAQSITEKKDKPKIFLTASNNGKEIFLRWAPDDADAWQFLNKYGYKIERYVVMRNKKKLAIPEKKELSSIAMKPLELEDWKPIVEKEKYAAVAAQAIFGKTLKVFIPNSSYQEMEQAATEKQQRFSIALFAADYSFDVALAMGLGFVDNTISKNETYIYMLSSLIPKDSLKIDTAKYLISGGEKSVLPAPMEVNASFGNRRVELSWNTKYLTQFFSSYSVERSDDGGKTYFAITNSPLIQAIPEVKELEMLKDIATYSDSLPKNNYKYYYRVMGRSIFGEQGPPSAPVSGVGGPEIVAPILTKPEVVNNKQIVVTWTFVDSLNKHISGFNVYQGKNISGPYQKLTIKLVGRNERKYAFEATTNNNYVYVAAVREMDGKEYSSLPRFAELIDTISPVKPKGGRGIIKTSGDVVVKWNKNPEDDIRGYRLYIANDPSDEFSQVTIGPVETDSFTFKIPLNNLSNELFCKIQAEDTHYNTSKFSDIVTLFKPDTIRPMSPLFKTFKGTSSAICLTWAASYSPDLAAYVLKRKRDDSTDFITIARLNPDVLAYCDATALQGKIYTYSIEAIDASNNRSLPTPTVSCERSKNLDRGILPLETNVDRTKKNVSLSWKMPAETPKLFVVYRAKADEPLVSIRNLPATAFRFFDNNLEINTSYTYQVIAEFGDGTEMRSKVLKVDY